MPALKLLLCLVCISISTASLGALAIVPGDVFSHDDIAKIVATEDYFYTSQWDDKTPIWRNTNRRYGSHYLKDRVNVVNLDQVIHKVLSDGMPVQYQLEALYRAKLGIHRAVGDLVPGINISFGEGAAALTINNVFSGLFSFLLPSNWMKFRNQERLYQVSKYILERTALDQILAAQHIYYDQHRRIQDFEIINYYFIHLQILAKKFPEHNRIIDTMYGEFAFQGTDMASQRGDTKLGFDDLALMMALQKVGKGTDFTASTLNIADITDFPTRVEDLDKLDEYYKDKEAFLEQVVSNSIELKIIRELHKISGLNVGITATGDSLSYVDRPANTNNDARFAIKFGYGTLPNILTSKSLSRTAKIDVQAEYIRLLDTARRSFDTYTNSLGGFTEAVRALALNRHAFTENLQYFIRDKSAMDQDKEQGALLILSLKNLIGTELKLNNALHGSLKAKALMDRFLVIQSSKAMNYLPSNGEILKFFEDVRNKNIEQIGMEEKIDQQMQKVKRTADLHHLLYSEPSTTGSTSLSAEDIKQAVRRNIGSLLYSKISFYKQKSFFILLQKYLTENEVELTDSEREVLLKKQSSVVTRLFKNERAAGAANSIDTGFEHFPRSRANDEL